MTQPPCQGCLCTGQASTSLESRISANLEAVQKGMDSADMGSVGRRISMNRPACNAGSDGQGSKATPDGIE